MAVFSTSPRTCTFKKIETARGVAADYSSFTQDKDAIHNPESKWPSSHLSDVPCTGTISSYFRFQSQQVVDEALSCDIILWSMWTRLNIWGLF